MSTISAITRRLMRHQRQRGLWATACFLLTRISRNQVNVVYEASCDERPAANWAEGDRIVEISAENLDSKLTPELREFLGAEAFESLEGVRNGDRLFVVDNGGGYLHCGYILFKTKETRILGEPESTPLIACCKTVHAARGRGLYRKALNTEIRYLLERGYKRVVISTHPDNLASRKGIEAAGFSLVRKVNSWIVLNRLVVQRSSQKQGTRWRVLFL